MSDKNRGLLYRTTGEVDEVYPAGDDFTLAELQVLVGGCIEPVPGTSMLVWCNEDGQRLKLQPNLIATVHASLLGFLAYEALLGEILFVRKAPE